jgi:hypothetical protein
MKKLKIAIVITLTFTAAFLVGEAARAGHINQSRGRSEERLVKTVFIRYVPSFQKEKPCDYDGSCDAGEKGWCADCKENSSAEPTNSCYAFLSGAKPRWNWVEEYHYEQGLEAVSKLATETWEGAVSKEIFGEGSEGAFSWGVYDGANSISYGDYPEDGVIAVTAIWHRAKTIYEYDIMFDDEYFPGDGTTDLATVVLHEFGHGAGLADLYNTECQGEVMYGYYQGEKTDLGEGDTKGIQALYGR